MRLRLVPPLQPRSFSWLLVVVGLAGCDVLRQTRPEAPPGPPASIRFVSGEQQSDTAMAMLSAPLSVEVRDSANRPVYVAPVSFEAIPMVSANGAVALPTFCTDTFPSQCSSTSYRDFALSGRASARVRLGRAAGTLRIVVTVPRTRLADTAMLLVRPGAAKRVSAFPRDSSAYVGNSYPVIARVLDQYGNVRAGESSTFEMSSAVATISATGVFNGRVIGRAFALVRSGALMDTAWITVPPRGTIAAVEQGAVGGSTIVKVELDGSGLKRLAPIRMSDVPLPDWISATEIAFEDFISGAKRIFVADTSGVVRRLTPAVTSTASEASPAGGPGSMVYLDAGSSGTYDLAIWRVRVPGEAPQRVGPNPARKATAWNARPSPDGLRLACVDVGGLQVIDVATGVMVSLNLPAAKPRWSPSGDWIVFGAGGTLHLVRPDGTGLRDVAGAQPFAPRADWSPDARWLIARSSRRLDLIEVQSGAILPLAWASGLVAPAFNRRQSTSVGGP